MSRELVEARAQLLFRKARNHLLDFTTYTMGKYQVNWHHQVVSNALMDVLEGRCKRLMVFQPPRTGKSELVSRRFPSFALGKDPSLKIMVTSYGADLANSMNRDVQRIIDTPDYRGLFPETVLPSMRGTRDGKYQQTGHYFDVVGTGGGYKSAGIGGAITGFGFNIGIIDDFIKERKDAESATYREALWNWYTSTFYSRRENDNAAIILTVTRWHQDDLAGRLLHAAENVPGADQWRVISLPAIMEDSGSNEYDPRSPGEPLWPNKYSLESLEAIRVNSGPRDWASLHQQSPFTQGGEIIKNEWWQLYEPDDLPRRWDQVIQSWDFTFKDTSSSDFVVGQVWGKKGSNKYLLDQVRRRMGFVESLEAVQNMCRKWPNAYTKVIEDKANGPAIIDTIKSKISGVVPWSPKDSKEARAHAISGQAEAGNLWLPKHAPWLGGYLKEWEAFPNGKNDDQVDATTQGVLKLSSNAVDRLQKMLTM